MGEGGHNVPLVYCETGIRKLTPKECFNIQGFQKEFKIPSNMSNTRAYKQADNSVAVPVIERIANNIKNILMFKFIFIFIYWIINLISNNALIFVITIKKGL